ERLVMIRSRLVGPVLGCLAWAGLAAGQVPAPTGAAAPERYVMIQTTGKPPQKCKIIKSWKQADGSTAHQVRVLDSGEILTLVEPAGGKKQASTLPARVETT